MKVEVPKGGVVLGVGVDLVEVPRIAALVERQGAAFLEKVFTEEERAYFEQRGTKGAESLAAFFAAKEAVAKCFGTGIGEEFELKSASVYHGERGEPLVRLDELGEKLVRRNGGAGVMLSLSHTSGMAMAVAVWVGERQL